MLPAPPEVQAILKKQGLKEIENVSSHYHNYCSICLNQKKETVYIKIRLYPKLVSHRNFAKEAIFTRFLSENFYRNKFFITPKYYKSELEKKPEWLIREYIKGTRMGDVWGFSPEFIKKLSPEELSGVLDFIRTDISNKFKIKVTGSRAKLFKKSTDTDYKKYFSEYSSIADKIIKPRQRGKAPKIFDRYWRFLAENNNYLAHGDLHPGNVVYNHKKVVIHDWKYAHWDNPYFDFTFMWFLFWQNEGWRDELFNLELKRAESRELFLKCFYLSALKLAPKMVSIFLQSSHVTEANRKKGVAGILSVFNKAVNYLEGGS